MDEKWNDDWREELKKDNYEAWIRLADCNNRRSDIKLYAKLIYKYNSNRSKEDCLDRAIEWITDWNSQPRLIPDDDEYKKILETM